MDKQALIELYQKRGYDEAAVRGAVEAVQALERAGLKFETCGVDDVKRYLDAVENARGLTIEELLALGRAFYIAGNNDAYIYFTRLLGGAGVIGSIRERLESAAGKAAADAVFTGLSEPPPGTPPEQMPAFTGELMVRIEQALEPDVYQPALAGNNHGLSAQAMEDEKRLFEQAADLDEYLKQRHARKVAELQEHCDTGRVWFEQQITQPVVDYVQANQEVLSAVREGGKLYVTKIPYDPDRYLKESDPVQKRYWACHCPFARESILGGAAVSENWCYCSGGFAKFTFEVILGRELQVKLLQSVLAGDNVCRFEIDIGEQP